jgi:ATP-dependent Zn protease
MNDKLLGIMLDKDGKPNLTQKQLDIVETELTRLINEAAEKSRQILSSKWGAVQKTVKTLMQKGSISGKEFDAIMADKSLSDEIYIKLTRKERLMSCEAMLTHSGS